jgi:hypothetical protein
MKRPHNPLFSLHPLFLHVSYTALFLGVFGNPRFWLFHTTFHTTFHALPSFADTHT